MQGKAEDTLSDLRKKEMSDVHSFEMVEGGLSDEISQGEEKLSTATKSKAANEQAKEEASGKLVETQKSKAADEDYAGTLKTECEAKSAEWDARQKSAKAEMAAIDKAKEILVSGVKAFVQVSTKTRRTSADDSDDDDNDDSKTIVREKVVNILSQLSNDHHSYALAQLVSIASSDPFVKIR